LLPFLKTVCNTEQAVDELRQLSATTVGQYTTCLIV
jgi:hypothetical protein